MGLEEAKVVPQAKMRPCKDEWVLRRFRLLLPSEEVQIGPFRSTDGALGGLIGPWKAWIMPQDAWMGPLGTWGTFT